VSEGREIRIECRSCSPVILLVHLLLPGASCGRLESGSSYDGEDDFLDLPDPHSSPHPACVCCVNAPVGMLSIQSSLNTWAELSS